jgi:hypothetical protein
VAQIRHTPWPCPTPMRKAARADRRSRLLRDAPRAFGVRTMCGRTGTDLHAMAKITSLAVPNVSHDKIVQLQCRPDLVARPS